jgi:hypothetical protein
MGMHNEDAYRGWPYILWRFDKNEALTTLTEEGEMLLAFPGRSAAEAFAARLDSSLDIEAVPVTLEELVQTRERQGALYTIVGEWEEPA